MNVRVIALLAAGLPFVGVHATYLLAASYELVDWCFPYLDSCTSISATGRKPPASYLFRVVMLPTAALLMVFWWFNYVWLTHCAGRSPVSVERSNRAMLALGVAAAVGLALYVAVLGERGDAWAFARRAGASTFFAFTYLAQLLLAHQLTQLGAGATGVGRPLADRLWVLLLATLAIGLLSVVLGVVDGAFYDTVEDAFEWVLALMLQAGFVLIYLAWRASGWDLQVSGVDER